MARSNRPFMGWRVGLPAIVAGTGLAAVGAGVARPVPCGGPVDVAKAPVNPTIEGVAFLAGDWSGERPGRGGAAFTQEVWSAPAGNNMMGMFRWVNADGQAGVFELLTITEEEGTLVLRLRHQDARGIAREGQDRPATLHLSRLASGDPSSDAATIVEFTDAAGSCDLASCTYDCSRAGRLTITVAFDDADRAELVFELERSGGVSGAGDQSAGGAGGAGGGMDAPVSGDGQERSGGGPGSPGAGGALPTEQARAVYERFTALEGEWMGRSTKGWEERISYQAVAKGSVVVERSVDAHPGEQMYTMVHMDGGRLMLTHYCVAGNQPRLVCTGWDEVSRAATFEFLDGTNLSSRDAGHMDKVVVRFMDSDHVTSRWTWYQDGVESWLEEIAMERVEER